MLFYDLVFFVVKSYLNAICASYGRWKNLMPTEKALVLERSGMVVAQEALVVDHMVVVLVGLEVGLTMFVDWTVFGLTIVSSRVRLVAFLHIFFDLSL